MPGTALPILGPCQVWWGVAGAESELGKTKGVTFRLTENAAPVTYDQTGTGPWDKITTGKSLEIECNFANLSYSLIARLAPTQATLYGAMPTPTPYLGDDALDYLLGLGTSHRDHSLRMIIIPYVDGVPTTDIEDRIYVPLCFPTNSPELTWDAETQRVWHCIFTAFPMSQAVPRLWFMGNEALLPH